MFKFFFCCIAQSRLSGKKYKFFQNKNDGIRSNDYSNNSKESLKKRTIEKNSNSTKSNHQNHKRVYSQTLHEDLKNKVKHRLLKLIGEVSKLIDYQSKFYKPVTNDSDIVKLHIKINKNSDKFKETFIKHKNDFKLNMDVSFYI